jgi:hypothetical protein
MARNKPRPRRTCQARPLSRHTPQKLSLTVRKGDGALQTLQCVKYRSFPVDQIIDQILQSYGQGTELDAERLAKSREKVIQYIDTLASAGQNDPRRLAVFARAYLKQLQEGPDPRFTGC